MSRTIIGTMMITRGLKETRGAGQDTAVGAHYHLGLVLEEAYGEQLGAQLVLGVAHRLLVGEAAEKHNHHQAGEDGENEQEEQGMVGGNGQEETEIRG